jgi:hypothetical protein
LKHGAQLCIAGREVCDGVSIKHGQECFQRLVKNNFKARADDRHPFVHLKAFNESQTPHAAHNVTNADRIGPAYQTKSARPTPHGLNEPFPSKQVSDLHQMVLRDAKTVRDLLDRNQLAAPDVEVRKDSEGVVRLQIEAHLSLLKWYLTYCLYSAGVQDAEKRQIAPDWRRRWKEARCFV